MTTISPPETAAPSSSVETVKGVKVEDIGRWSPYMRVIGRPLTRLFWRVELDGLENLPESGGAIIAPNHISFIDSSFLAMLLPRPITFVGKAEYLDDWKTRALFPALGMIPIDRSGGQAAKDALGAAADVLRAGGLFGIYPEGTRSRTGELHKGHTGAARLAIDAGVPIIPTGIIGTAEIQPPDTPMPRPFRAAKLRFGAPIDPRRYLDAGADRLVHRRMIDEVMFEIRQLTGQRYVDRYATRKAQSVPTATATLESRPLAAAAVG
ncbi:MAG: lysophospholipid acyltransferase family protein [Actinomycetota bacterium]